MKQTIRRIIGLASFCFCLFFFLTAIEGLTAPKPISFLWAFIVQNNAGETKTIDPGKGEANLTVRDRFKIFIKPEENAYVYLFLLDGQGSLSLVFPEYMDFFRQGYSIGTSYHVPEGNDWLYVDEKNGTETFYLLASCDRLSKLEQLTQTYVQQSTLVQKDAAKTALAGKLVLDEIKRLRLERFSMQSNPEKPVPVAGNYRGVGKHEEVLATEVKADGFYAKTILILH